jgi:hypothetical protein
MRLLERGQRRFTEASAGNLDRVTELAAQALRMSPKDRWVGTAHLAYAMSAFIEQDLTRLRGRAEIAIQSHPTAPIRPVLMILYAAEVGARPCCALISRSSRALRLI